MSRPFQTLLGSVPSDWEILNFEDIVDFQEGPGILAKDFRESGVPLLRLKSIQGPTTSFEGCNYLDESMVQKRWSHFRLKRNDILVSTSASFGRTSTVAEEQVGCICYTGIIRMRPRTTSLNRKFLGTFLSSQLFLRQAEASGSGSVIRHFGPSHLRQMMIVLPPLNEQRRISAILGALDDKIELNRRMNQTLEEMAQAIFKSWFIDFDGHTDFVDSELGPIPRGWQVGTFGDVAKNYREIVQPEDLDPSTPYLGLADMPQRSIALNEWNEVAEVTSAKATFQRGDLLFGKLRPYFKKVGVAPVDGVCSSDILVVRPATPEWRGYLLGVLTYDPFVDFTAAVSTGTRMPRVSWKSMAGYGLALPPEDEARQYNEVVIPMVEKILCSIEKSRTLAELRDTLLPKLISGEIRVPETEEAIEEIV